MNDPDMSRVTDEDKALIARLLPDHELVKVFTVDEKRVFLIAAPNDIAESPQ